MGADISLVKRSLAKQLGLKLEPTTENAVSIYKHTFKLFGCVRMNVYLGHQCLSQHPLYLTDELPYDALLGFDVLLRLSYVLLNARDGQLHFYSKCPKFATEILPFGEVQSLAEWPVTLAEDVELPPQVQAILLGQCTSAPPKDLLFEPAAKLAKEVIIACALACPVRGTVPVRLINPLSKPVKLYRNSTLGKLQLPPNSDTVVHTLQAQGQSMQPWTSTQDSLQSIDLSKATLNGEQQKQLQALLKRNRDLFAMDNLHLGCLNNGIEHTINTGDHLPLRQRAYRTEISRRKEVDQHIQEMLDAGVVRPSQSPW